ncbi:MAG TPA: isoaspartyl peptidase/L-asparaginase [Sphingomonas sp.]|jgi:beta-aspartyl-peptidase (threonine type)
MRWTLVIHGGAGQIGRGSLSTEVDAGARAGLASALEAGAAILRTGGAALDAVEAAVRVLEDDPHFNAGRGAVLGYDGHVSLDAAIMDGRDRSAGAVAGVTTPRNPVTLARAVMERSPHVLLASRGADGFAAEQGVAQAGEDWFVLPARRAQLAAMRASEDWFDADMKYGTVGAVACDAHGHVAAATSTGGVTGKRWGRVGDSPVPGAGTYADDRSAAISCTGSGEVFLRVGVGHEIGARVRLGGAAPLDAAVAVMDEVRGMGGTGGVIVVDPAGIGGWRFTTPGMYRGVASSEGAPRVAIYADEG